MILGFHYHIPAVEMDGRVYTSGFLGRFLDSLASQVDELVCFMHTPLETEEFLMDYSLKSANVRLVSLGPHASVPTRILKSKWILKAVAGELDRIDVMLIRCPTPLLPALARMKGVIRAYLIVGDYEKSSRDLVQPFFRKKAIQFWARWNKRKQEIAIKNSLVFVNNGLIYNELKSTVKDLHLVRTTTLQKSDFFVREDTCNGSVINLLYTGRFDLSKGLKEMIEALAVVRKAGYNAVLNFVGWEEQNRTSVKSFLLRFSQQLLLSDFVFFHGRKQVGDELNAFYRLADIYLIGSKVNEGFPRTIWEAFANSLPVIASRVGSIPLFLTNRVQACLVEPGSSEEMAAAIIEVINNPTLRATLLHNSYEMARESLSELQARNMTEIMRDKYCLK